MRVRRLCVLAFASVLLVQGVSAQLTTSQVENALASFRWRGSNAVLLRGFYSGKALHFNETGQIVDPHPGLWGVDGWMFLDKIAIKDGVLTLRGQRVVAVLGTEKSADASLNVKLWKTGSRDVTLILPMPADESVLQRIFSGVFLPPDEPFVSAMPELWQKFYDHTPAPKLDPDRMAKPPSMMGFDGVEYFTGEKGVKPLNQSLHRIPRMSLLREWQNCRVQLCSGALSEPAAKRSTSACGELSAQAWTRGR